MVVSLLIFIIINNIEYYYMSNINQLPPNFRNIGSLFTNNSMVYYKKGSLPSCGIGSVRNSSVKSKRI